MNTYKENWSYVSKPENWDGSEKNKVESWQFVHDHGGF